MVPAPRNRVPGRHEMCVSDIPQPHPSLPWGKWDGCSADRLRERATSVGGGGGGSHDLQRSPASSSLAGPLCNPARPLRAPSSGEHLQTVVHALPGARLPVGKASCQSMPRWPEPTYAFEQRSHLLAALGQHSNLASPPVSPSGVGDHSCLL